MKTKSYINMSPNTYVRSGKVDLLCHSANYLICIRVDGHYSFSNISTSMALQLLKLKLGMSWS